MSGYNDLEIYRLAYNLAKRVHFATLKLPAFEIYEQGSQIRRSSKSVKDQIAEGYGRRRYKSEYIKYLVYAQSSCDEAASQSEMINDIYPEFPEFHSFINEYRSLGRMINKYIQYVETSWKT